MDGKTSVLHSGTDFYHSYITMDPAGQGGCFVLFCFVFLGVAYHNLAQLRDGTKQAKTIMCERQLAYFKLLYPWYTGLHACILQASNLDG
jgi:hypothetical protein